MNYLLLGQSNGIYIMNLRLSAAPVLGEVVSSLASAGARGEQGPGDLGSDPTEAKRRP